MINRRFLSNDNPDFYNYINKNISWYEFYHYINSSEFYKKILSIKGANQEFYDQAKKKLRKISND